MLGPRVARMQDQGQVSTHRHLLQGRAEQDHAPATACSQHRQGDVRGGWLCPQGGSPFLELCPSPPALALSQYLGDPCIMLEAERVLSVSFGAQLLKLGQGRPSQLPAGLLRALRSLVLPPLARLRRPGLPVSLLPEPGGCLPLRLWSLSVETEPRKLDLGSRALENPNS